ncbi:MAG: hypothetical protein LBV46_04455, partial [Bacteroidales bacterium]|nr:hypothetical protein [Bacteroidales bacterium]
MKYNFLSTTLLLLLLHCGLSAQQAFDCETVIPTIQQYDVRVAQLHTNEPRLVSLNYLLAKDIDTELKRYFDTLVVNVRN